MKLIPSKCLEGVGSGGLDVVEASGAPVGVVIGDVSGGTVEVLGLSVVVLLLELVVEVMGWVVGCNNFHVIVTYIINFGTIHFESLTFNVVMVEAVVGELVVVVLEDGIVALVTGGNDVVVWGSGGAPESFVRS